MHEPLPEPLPRILKQPAGERVALASLEERSFTEPLRRVPGRHVQGAAPLEEVQEAHAPRPVIIRRQAAQHTARPVALAPPAFGPAFAPPAVAPVEEPSPPEELPEERLSLAALQALEAEWQARLDAAVEQARREGFEAGADAATAELQAAVDAAAAAFARDLTRIEAAAAEALRRAEPLLATLAFDVAEAILGAPLPASVRAVSERTLAEAVERAAGEAPVDLVLHPVDYLRLQEAGVVDQLGSLNSSLRWHPDPDLKQGDWIVQSPTATTRRLEAELLASLRRQLGLGNAECGLQNAD